MPIQNSKWHAYVADIDIMAHRVDSPFGLTVDVSLLCFGALDVPESLAFCRAVRSNVRTLDNLTRHLIRSS
jgi:hypothetical protein